MVALNEHLPLFVTFHGVGFELQVGGPKVSERLHHLLPWWWHSQAERQSSNFNSTSNLVPTISLPHQVVFVSESIPLRLQRSPLRSEAVAALLTLT